MFSKSSKTNTKVARTDDTVKKISPSGIPSILSSDLCLVGDLNSTGDLQIDGTVQGDIICKTITIGENAVVTGSVKADDIRVCGMVSGHLIADNITLASTAKVDGDILHKSIAIEAGAQVEGQFRIMSEKDEVTSKTVVAGTPQLSSSPASNVTSNVNGAAFSDLAGNSSNVSTS